MMIETHPETIAGHIYLTAALAMQGELTAATQARDTLLRLWPEMSIARQRANAPLTEELAERMREGLRKAGVPEK